MSKLPTTWPQICKAKGISDVIPDVSAFPKEMHAYMQNCYTLPIIIEVLNADIEPEYIPWIPDYTDFDQVKYEIWWDVKADKKRPSGFGLSYHDCGDLFSASRCGPRFCFRDLARAKHAAKYFLKEHEAHHLL